MYLTASGDVTIPCAAYGRPHTLPPVTRWWRSDSVRTVAWLALCGLVGTAIRLRRLAEYSLWFDELCSVRLARLGWRLMLAHLRSGDVHPPLYFALLRLWGGVHRLDEAGARLPSVAFGVVAIVSAAWFATEVWGRRAGSLAAALMTVSPFAVAYSREARAYSLLLALTLGASAALLRALRTGRTWDLAGYGLLAATLPYVHVFGFFTLGAQVCFAVLLVMTPDARRVGLRLLGAQMAAVALFTPWLPVMVHQARNVERGFWLQRPTLAGLKELAQGSTRAAPLWTCGLVVTALVGIAGQLRRAPRRGLLLVALVTFPTLLPIGLSFVSQPIFVARACIAGYGALLVCAAGCLAQATRSSRGVVRVVAALLAAGLIAAGGVEVTAGDLRPLAPEPWREFCAYVAATCVRPGMASVTPFWLYREFVQIYVGDDAPVFTVLLDAPAHDPDALARTLVGARDTDHFCYIGGRDDGVDPPGLRDLVRGWHPRVVGSRTFAPLRVTVWERDR